MMQSQKLKMIRKDTNYNVDLSIVITAHAEGRLLHKTIASILRATSELKDKYVFEVILHLDNPTNETIEYVDQNKDKVLKNIIIFRNSFGDPALSRNFCVSQSHGRYVAITDGDDLYSKTTFKNALSVLEKSKTPIVVHPEYTISFDSYNSINKKYNSRDLTLDTLKMVHENLWGSNSVASRNIYEDYPYLPNDHIFGYEDKFFNAQTLANSIKHVTTPDILFYRRKKESLLAAHNSRCTEVRKTKLFDFEQIKNVDIKSIWHDEFTKPPVPGAMKRLVALVSRALSEYHKANRKISDKYADMTIDPAQNNTPFREIEPWVIDEWKEMHQIDQKVFPSDAMLRGIDWYKGDQNIRPGLCYVKTIQQMSKKPDTLFFVPWLIKGGADKVFINYANTLAENNSWDIAVLQTIEDKKSVWSDKLSRDIDFVDYAEIVSKVSRKSRLKILAQIVVQNDIKRLIVGNSDMAYDFIEMYRSLLEGLGVTIYVFAFCETFDKEGKRSSQVHTGLPKVYDSTYKVITDNSAIVEKLVDEYAFDPKKFVVHYQPAMFDMKPTVIRNSKPLKVLWASRISQQKRPDLLIQIANKLDKNEFSIDAYGELEESFEHSYFEDSGVNYKRAFNGINDIPTENYDLFLYTSESDGIPNMLQEMTAAGLPIVASNAGGIKEFIHEGTGVLINDITDVKSYLEGIKSLRDPKLRKKLNVSAQKLLLSMFDENIWRKDVLKDIDK